MVQFVVWSMLLGYVCLCAFTRRQGSCAKCIDTIDILCFRFRISRNCLSWNWHIEYVAYAESAGHQCSLQVRWIAHYHSHKFSVCAWHLIKIEQPCSKTSENFIALFERKAVIDSTDIIFFLIFFFNNVQVLLVSLLLVIVTIDVCCWIVVKARGFRCVTSMVWTRLARFCVIWGQSSSVTCILIITWSVNWIQWQNRMFGKLSDVYFCQSSITRLPIRLPLLTSTGEMMSGLCNSECFTWKPTKYWMLLFWFIALGFDYNSWGAQTCHAVPRNTRPGTRCDPILENLWILAKRVNGTVAALARYFPVSRNTYWTALSFLRGFFEKFLSIFVTPVVMFYM